MTRDKLSGSQLKINASIVIVTKDRKDQLRRALGSAIQQDGPIEVMVLDDGSSDGTVEMVRTEFPRVMLYETKISLGCIAQRNRTASLCSSEIIISIDDDAEFSTPKVVEQTLRAFSHPRIVAIAIPYIEPHKSNQKLQIAPSEDAIWITDSFRGTAYAMRRDVFLKVGWYRDKLVHQGEEMDLCIRLLNLGLIVRLGSGDTIVHHEYSARDWRRSDFYGRRNDILFAVANVPMPYFPVHLLGTTLNGVCFSFKVRRAVSMIRGLVSGYLTGMLEWERKPVSIDSYRLHRMLKKRGPKMLKEVEPRLESIRID